jgi:hypothetical protein
VKSNLALFVLLLITLSTSAFADWGGRFGRPGHGPGHGNPGWGDNRGQTINLGGNSCGYGQGFCDCQQPGPIYTPDSSKAQAICQQLGFQRLVSFQTSPGVLNALQCSGPQGSCFRNANEGNLICSSVTCSRF